MGLGALIAAFSAANTAASAASAAKKNSSKTSSSSSSSGSSGNRTSGSSSGGSSGSSYTPIGSHNDATIRDNAPDYASQLDSIKGKWNEAHAAGDQAAMDKYHKDAENLRAQFGYSGGSDGSDYIGTGGMTTFTPSSVASARTTTK